VTNRRDLIAGNSRPVRVAVLRRSWNAVAIAMVVLAAGTAAGHGAFAQAAGTPQPSTAKKGTDAELLADFIHYTRIANYAIAEAKGRELLSRNLSQEDFVTLIEAGDVARFEETTQRAMRVQQLEPIAAGMNKVYELGVLSRARSPEQIAKNIIDLTGNARTRALARERLLAAGEYAMPQLLENLLNGNQPLLQNAVQPVIVALGRQAVIPLGSALMKLPPAQQERVADLIGLIQYRTSLPFLSDVMESTTSDAVRAATVRAIDRLGGADAGASDLYRALATAYYDEKSEVTSFPGEEHQLLWSYDPAAGGLLMTAVRTPVFHEAMAMGLLERGMQLEIGTGGVNPETLALWVASNFSREIDTPEGYVNPVYPVAGAAEPGVEPRRGAMYYAVASGADIAQRVLARALDNRDTPLARLALSSVEQTAGGNALWGNGTRMPLLEAITYPSRRVQYEAALALAAAQPQSPFIGSERVVPTLASTIRGAGVQVAAVVAAEAESYQGVRRVLTNLGYTVLPQGRTLSDLDAPIAEAAAVDLIVGVGISGDRVPAFIDEIRGRNKTSAVPVLVLTNVEMLAGVRRRYETDATVMVRQVGLNEETLSKAGTELVQRASGGPIDAAEAGAYAQRSLAALRDLAVSQSTVLNAGDAALPLMGALSDQTGSSRMKIAEILSMIGQDRAQRALMDAAIAAGGDEQVDLLGLVADSAKRFGNLLEARQVTRVVELAAQGQDAEATAAASLMGALNLSNAELVPLILQKK